MGNSFLCVFWFTCGCSVTCTLEPLIFGTRDWLLFGTFLCGLFSQPNPLPGHRLVPESHYVFNFDVIQGAHSRHVQAHVLHFQV